MSKMTRSLSWTLVWLMVMGRAAMVTFGASEWGTAQAQTNGVWKAWLEIRVVPGTELSRVQSLDQRLYVGCLNDDEPRLLLSGTSTGHIPFWLGPEGVVAAEGFDGKGARLFFPSREEPVFPKLPLPVGVTNHYGQFRHFARCWFSENALLYECQITSIPDHYMLGVVQFDAKLKTASSGRILLHVADNGDVVYAARVAGNKIVFAGNRVFWKNTGYDNFVFLDAVKGIWRRSELRTVGLGPSQLLSGEEISDAILSAHREELENVFDSGTLEAARAHRPATALVFQEDRLIFNLPGGKRLVCVNLQGKKLWERNYEHAVRLFRGPSSEPMLQDRKTIGSVSAETGDLRPMFSVEDENEQITFSTPASSFICRTTQAEKSEFKIIDEHSGKSLWKETLVEDIVGSAEDCLVFLENSEERASPRQGFFVAYDRTTFETKWRQRVSLVPGSSGFPWAFRSPYLVYPDYSGTLCILDCTTGRHGTWHVENPSDHFGAIALPGHQLVWVSARPNRNDPTQTEQTLHFCTVPKFKEQRAVTVVVRDINEISCEGELIVSDGFFRTACFGPGGEKIWEHRHTVRTPVVENRIYFLDNDSDTLRVGFVELSTGHEKILYRELLEQEY